LSLASKQCKTAQRQGDDNRMTTAIHETVKIVEIRHLEIRRLEIEKQTEQ